MLMKNISFHFEVMTRVKHMNQRSVSVKGLGETCFDVGGLIVSGLTAHYNQ